MENGVKTLSVCMYEGVYDLFHFAFVGKWFMLKKLLFMTLLHLRNRQQKSASKSGGPGYGVKSRSSIEEMECVQPLCDDEMVSQA